MNNKQIPSIRFKGYNEVWEQHKFGELLQTLPFKPFLKEPEQDGKYEIIQQGSEPIIGFANGIPCNDYKDTVIFGDHTLSLYKPKRPFFVATDGVRIIKSKQNIDGCYLLSLLERYKPQSEGYKRYYSILSDIECFIINNTNEQKQIGSYFEQLDNLITLYQHKYDKLINIKKSMLQKMFPKDETDIPEIRFKGFNDVWEQRKLGEFGKATGGTSIESEFNEKGKYKVISIGSYSETGKYIDQSIRVNKTNKTKNRILNKNDLAMILNDKTASGNIIGRVLLIDTDDSYVYNQRTERIEVYKNDFEPEFLYHLLNADNIRSKIIRASQGNTQIYVNWTSISTLTYEIPSLKEEQAKISTFFTDLDRLITLHQCKLEKLQNIKKSMLEKMFPSNK